MAAQQKRPKGKRPRLATAHAELIPHTDHSSTGSQCTPARIPYNNHTEAQCRDLPEELMALNNFKRKPVPGSVWRRHTSEVSGCPKNSELSTTSKAALPAQTSTWDWPIPEAPPAMRSKYGGAGRRAELPSSKRPHPELARRQEKHNAQHTTVDIRDDAMNPKEVLNELPGSRNRSPIGGNDSSDHLSSVSSTTEHQRHDSVMSSQTEYPRASQSEPPGKDGTAIGEAQQHEKRTWWVFE